LKSVEDSLSNWRNIPVQILWGMQDWCFHQNILKVWESILPDATIHRFENAGHYLMEDAGDAVIAALREFSDELA
jgi:haloalkane dehalogenase